MVENRRSTALGLHPSVVHHGCWTRLKGWHSRPEEGEENIIRKDIFVMPCSEGSIPFVGVGFCCCCLILRFFMAGQVRRSGRACRAELSHRWAPCLS